MNAVQQNVNVETTLESDLTSNNSDESFFLDISKLNRKLDQNKFKMNHVIICSIYVLQMVIILF